MAFPGVIVDQLVARLASTSVGLLAVAIGPTVERAHGLTGGAIRDSLIAHFAYTYVRCEAEAVIIAFLVAKWQTVAFITDLSVAGVASAHTGLHTVAVLAAISTNGFANRRREKRGVIRISIVAATSIGSHAVTILGTSPSALGLAIVYLSIVSRTAIILQLISRFGLKCG